MGKLNGISLFTGYGGIDLALQDYVRPLIYCDIERYAQALQKNLTTARPGRTTAPSLKDDRRLYGGETPNQMGLIWPTPAAQDHKNATLPPSQMDRDTIPGELLRQGTTGKLNPTWVEWLMGVPSGMTELRPWVMEWFRSKRKQRLKS